MPNGSKKMLYTLFADDTCLFASHKNPKSLEIIINSEQAKINDWLVDNNRLTLNAKKSCLIYFSGKKENPKLKVSIAGKRVSRCHNRRKSLLETSH